MLNIFIPDIPSLILGASIILDIQGSEQTNQTATLSLCLIFGALSKGISDLCARLRDSDCLVWQLRETISNEDG